MLKPAHDKRDEMTDLSEQRHQHQLQQITDLINSTPSSKGGVVITLQAEKPGRIKQALWDAGYYVSFTYPDQWKVNWNCRCNSPEQQRADEEYRKKMDAWPYWL